MSETVKNASVCILAGIIAGCVSHGLRSPYLSNFLEANLILLLIALLAINTTTISVIMTKLRELSSKPSDFRRTAHELKWSVREQVILVILSILLLTLKKSQLVVAHVPHSDFGFEVLLLSGFFYAIYILYDTANAVFDIMSFEQNDPEQK